MSKIPRLFELISKKHKKAPAKRLHSAQRGFFKKTRRQETIGKNGGCRTALPASLSYHMPPTKSTKILESVTTEKSEMLYRKPARRSVQRVFVLLYVGFRELHKHVCNALESALVGVLLVSLFCALWQCNRDSVILFLDIVVLPPDLFFFIYRHSLTPFIHSIQHSGILCNMLKCTKNALKYYAIFF